VRGQRLILIRVSEATPELWQALFRSAVARPDLYTYLGIANNLQSLRSG